MMTWLFFFQIPYKKKYYFVVENSIMLKNIRSDACSFTWKF